MQHNQLHINITSLTDKLPATLSASSTLYPYPGSKTGVAPLVLAAAGF
jgi:hypothetical protein